MFLTFPFEIWAAIFSKLFTVIPISMSCKHMHHLVCEYLKNGKLDFTGIVLAKAMKTQRRWCAADYIFLYGIGDGFRQIKAYKKWVIDQKILTLGELCYKTDFLVCKLLQHATPQEFVFASCVHPLDIIAYIQKHRSELKELLIATHPTIIAILCMVKYESESYIEEVFKARDIEVLKKLLPMLVASNYDIETAARAASREVFQLAIREGCLVKKTTELLRDAGYSIPDNPSIVKYRLASIRRFIYESMRQLEVYRAEWGTQTFSVPREWWKRPPKKT